MAAIDKLKAWLCLKTAPGLKHRQVLELLESYPDPCEYVGDPAHPIYNGPLIPPAAAPHLKEGLLPNNFPQIERLCEHHDIRLLCYTDDAYPIGLREIFSPPLLMYYRGDAISALRNKTLAVVGTRKPTAYGREMCERLLGPVCKQNVAIISGLAVGIDTVAHLAALDNGASTIAVLASGVESIYPPQNRELAKRIIQQGALLSEYEPGSKLERWNFPARNRIVSALAESVFVVEGSMKSGALLTAKFAVEQDRGVYALPGNINHPNAQGPNYLIKAGAALISCPEDLLSNLGLESEVKDQLEILPEISQDEQAIYDLYRNEQREISFDELVLKTGFSFGKLSVALLNLELKGYLSKASGNSFILA
jgi:DNA processing protein